MNIRKRDILDFEVWQIRELMVNGTSESLPQKTVEYIQWMEKARDLYYANKTPRYVVRQLQQLITDSTGEKISEWLARKVFDDAMNFFYSSDSIRKDSWRNLLSEKYLMMYSAAWEANEWEFCRSCLKEIQALKRLNEVEKSLVDPRLFDRRPRFYFTNSKELGGISVDRNELLNLIERYDIQESERRKIKMEAGVIDRKLFVEDVDFEKVDE